MKATSKKQIIQQLTQCQFDDIPDLMLDLISIYKREIEILKCKPQLDQLDWNNSVRLMKELNNIYLAYRVLRTEIQAGLKARTPQEVQQQVKSIIMSN